MPQSMSDPDEKIHPIPHCEWCGEIVKRGWGNLAFQLGPVPNMYGWLDSIATSLCGNCHLIWLAILRSKEVER